MMGRVQQVGSVVGEWVMNVQREQMLEERKGPGQDGRRRG